MSSHDKKKKSGHNARSVSNLSSCSYVLIANIATRKATNIIVSLYSNTYYKLITASEYILGFKSGSKMKSKVKLMENAHMVRSEVKTSVIFGLPLVENPTTSKFDFIFF